MSEEKITNVQVAIALGWSFHPADISGAGTMFYPAFWEDVDGKMVRPSPAFLNNLDDFFAYVFPKMLVMTDSSYENFEILKEKVWCILLGEDKALRLSELFLSMDAEKRKNERMGLCQKKK